MARGVRTARLGVTRSERTRTARSIVGSGARSVRRIAWAEGAARVDEIWESMKTVKAHLAALVAVVLFGLMSPACKFAYQAGLVDGLSVGVLRLAGGAVSFGVLAFLLGQTVRIERGDWLSVLGMALTGMVFNQCLYVTGIQFTSPVNACVIGSVAPVMVLVFSVVFLGVALTLRKVVGMALALAGALTLVLGSALTGGHAGSPVGDGMCILSQTSAACYFVFFGRIVHKYSPIGLLAWVFLVAAVLTMPLAVWKWGLIVPGLAHGPTATAVAYVVFGGTVGAYLFLLVAQRHLEPPVVATYNYVQPIVAAIAGVAMALDRITWQKCVACVLIAGGVWLVTHARRN